MALSTSAKQAMYLRNGSSEYDYWLQTIAPIAIDHAADAIPLLSYTIDSSMPATSI
jgi:hypothetical protein